MTDTWCWFETLLQQGLSFLLGCMPMDCGIKEIAFNGFASAPPEFHCGLHNACCVLFEFWFQWLGDETKNPPFETWRAWNAWVAPWRARNSIELQHACLWTERRLRGKSLQAQQTAGQPPNWRKGSSVLSYQVTFVVQEIPQTEQPVWFGLMRGKKHWTEVRSWDGEVHFPVPFCSFLIF